MQNMASLRLIIGIISFKHLIQVHTYLNYQLFLHLIRPQNICNIWFRPTQQTFLDSTLDIFFMYWKLFSCAKYHFKETKFWRVSSFLDGIGPGYLPDWYIKDWIGYLLENNFFWGSKCNSFMTKRWFFLSPRCQQNVHIC